MANDLNQCMFIGRLGKDPEVKYMPSGDAVVSFSLAVGKKWKDKNTSEVKEATTWVPVNYFGAVAEIVGKFCKKGSQVMVTGEFTVRKWVDKDGNDRYATEIRGDKLQLLGSAPGEAGAAPAQRPAAAPAARPAAAAPAPAPARKPAPADDDSIPF